MVWMKIINTIYWSATMLNFNWLADFSIESAKWIFLILFILIGVVVLMIPNKYIYEGLTKIRWWHI